MNDIILCCYCNKPVDATEEYSCFHKKCYDKYEDFKNEQDDMICPWCEYEFKGYEKPYEVEIEDTICPCCGKTFTYEATSIWEWRTYKREEEFKQLEQEDLYGKII